MHALFLSTQAASSSTHESMQAHDRLPYFSFSLSFSVSLLRRPHCSSQGVHIPQIPQRRRVDHPYPAQGGIAASRVLVLLGAWVGVVWCGVAWGLGVWVGVVWGLV